MFQKRLKRLLYNKKRIFLMGFFSLFLLCFTIGYALLTVQLNIDGIGKLSKATWNVHFENIKITDGSIEAITEPTISDQTTVNFSLTLSSPGDFYDFTVDVVNSGTINAKISSFNITPTLTTDQQKYLDYTVTYLNGDSIEQDQPLVVGMTRTIKVHFEYKEIEEVESYPSNDQTINISVQGNYEQDTGDYDPEHSIIKMTNSSDRTAFRSDTYRDKIKTLTLSDIFDEPENVIESWDISENSDGNVMAYVTQNSEDNTMYDLYIQGNGHLYANPNSQYLFANLRGLDKINNIEALDTSNVTDMSYMFNYTGYNSLVFTLDLGDKFDTYNVTNMTYMFSGIGYNSLVFTLDLGNRFDTSNVENMRAMFYLAGHESTSFILDLGEKFDTSSAITTSLMFAEIGYKCQTFTLDLGENFDTSNVTDMSLMFWNACYNCSTFTLDLGENFDTSNVTNMNQMFRNTAYFSINFVLDISTFDFSNVNVTSSSYIFSNWRSTQKIYVKDVAAQNWVITNGGSSNLTTSNVLIKT